MRIDSLKGLYRTVIDVFECGFHTMSVHDSAVCRSTVPRDVGPKMKWDNQLLLLPRGVVNNGSSEVVHAQDSGDSAAQI